MASHSFALTKIQPPRPRASLIVRDPLEQRMAAAARGKRLVLLAAPAGFGKTAALTRLIARLGTDAAVAWIAVDVDDDPLGLLACLCAALEPFDPPWRIDPEALVAMAGGSRADRRTAASELINALAACDVARGLIVVDDAHRIRDPAVFEFLDQLLERLPPHWGVIVSTRTDPPLALARLRAHEELAEFRERDLRFGLDEVHALLPELPESRDVGATCARLLERTHGWAVGLRLAVNGLGSGAGNGSMVGDGATDRHVFDYLLAEVLDAMPADLRSFLLRCSVLSELTAGRCAAVSADARAASWLDEIERRGLFVSVLEGPEPTLRLHDLFRDFLLDRLRREMTAELPALYRRAAAGEPDTLRRIGYLICSGDWSNAEAVLAEAGGEIILAVGPGPVLRLLEQFPAWLRERSGVLAHVRCLCAWARWDWVAMQAAASAGAARLRARRRPARGLALPASTSRSPRGAMAISARPARASPPLLPSRSQRATASSRPSCARTAPSRPGASTRSEPTTGRPSTPSSRATARSSGTNACRARWSGACRARAGRSHASPPAPCASSRKRRRRCGRSPMPPRPGASWQRARSRQRRRP